MNFILFGKKVNTQRKTLEELFGKVDFEKLIRDEILYE